MKAPTAACPDAFPDEKFPRILIADPDRSFASSLEQLLVQWGYRVQTVFDGNRAWDCLRSQPPDLALLDLMIPEISGIELCRKVRLLKCPYRTYIILLSSQTATEDRVVGLEAGADDYITKPIDFETFQARVKVASRMARLQHRLAGRALVLEESLAEVRQLEQDAEAGRQREHFLAFHDSLTGLPNRQLFFDRLQQITASAQRTGQSASVLFLDLNGFKEINDTLGHSGGDLLIRLVGQRLKDCLRESDTVARLGGDEFGIITSGLTRTRDTEIVVQRILRSLEESFIVEGQSCQVGASIGISIYPADAGDVENLVKRADIAMYRAKHAGQSNCVFYGQSNEPGLTNRQLVEDDLREAVLRNELILHYQPQVSLATGAFTGMEAFVRWRRPGNGLLYPNEFLPIAEEAGLIAPIGRWVLHAACKHAALRRSSDGAGIRMAVNLSTRQFRGVDFLHTVAEVLHETQLLPSELELEITEHAATQNLDQSIKTMFRLKDMGVRLALDDFGAGLSSLNSLKRFPIDTLKIDRTLIQGLPLEADNAAIVSAIIFMAHRIGLGVVAEGVETLEQWKCLRSLGCDEAQGFLVSQPINPEALNELFRGGLSFAQDASAPPTPESHPLDSGFNLDWFAERQHREASSRGHAQLPLSLDA